MNISLQDLTPFVSRLAAGGNAADGFAALVDQDTNADGQVNANDANFSQLRLWQDLNQNGISEAWELFTLAQKGIASIAVAKTENNTQLPDGNVLADVGSYTKTDGTQGTIGETGSLGDVDLTENTFFSQYPGIPLTPEAQSLPDMHGSGRVRNLREAASLSGDLTNALTTFANTTTRTDQIGQLDGLLKAWSDTSDLPDIVSRALAAGYLVSFGFGNEAHDDHRNQFVYASAQPESPYAAQLLYNEGQSPEYQAWIDKLTLLERFNGRNFFNFNPPANPPNVTFSIADPGSTSGVAYLYPMPRIDLNFSQEQLNFLNQSYEALRQSVYNALFLQTRGKEYLDAIGLSVTDNGAGEKRCQEPFPTLPSSSGR